MPFKAFIPLSIPDVILIEPRVFDDERGFFAETYKASPYTQYDIPPFVQTNHSHSLRDVLRGLHYQKAPMAQGKLVTCVRGAIFDVGVDIRQGSPTYGQWVGAELSAENHRLLYIPPGFAHGFCTLSDVADVIYQVTAEYAHDLDRGIIWNDPELGIDWPVDAPRLSPKDARQPLLRDADNDFRYGAH